VDLDIFASRSVVVFVNAGGDRGGFGFGALVVSGLALTLGSRRGRDTWDAVLDTFMHKWVK